MQFVIRPTIVIAADIEWEANKFLRNRLNEWFVSANGQAPFPNGTLLWWSSLDATKPLPDDGYGDGGEPYTDEELDA